jgi:hypothetical protein
MDTAPSALIKVSWKTGVGGSPIEGGNAAIGGISGTAFSLSNGIVLTASHHLDDLWKPHEGFDDFEVWIGHPDGSHDVLPKGCFHHFPGFDIARIDCRPSIVQFAISKKPFDDIKDALCLGYEAHTAPFTCGISGKRLSIYNLALERSLIPFKATMAAQKVIECRAADVFIDSKRGYILQHPATIGLSGGPMVDASDRSVVAVCCLGLPPDSHQKQTIGAVDLRDLPI